MKKNILIGKCIAFNKHIGSIYSRLDSLSFVSRQSVLAILVACLTVLGVGNAWGDETLTITGSIIGGSSGYSSSSATATTDNDSDVDVEWTDALENSTPLQLKASTGVFLSTSCPSGFKIKSIKITSVTNTMNLSCSSDGSSWSSSLSYTDGTALDVASSNYKYFRVTATSKYTKANSIVVVYTASTPQTVTFDKQGGTFDDPSVFTNTNQITEASGGAGITLPLVNPSAACAAEGWGFYGWKASSAVTSETTTAPTIVGKAGDTYYPAGATTLYAVFAKGEYTKITSSGDLESDKKYIIAIKSSGGDYYVVTDSYSYSSVGEIKCKQISETSSNKYSAAAINANWRYSIEGSGTYYIRDVVSSSSNNYVDFAYVDFYGSTEDDEDMYTFTFDGDGYCWIENDYAYAYFDETNYTFTRNTDDVSEFFLYKETSTPYYNSNPSCCANEVSVSESGSSHISSMTFSASSVPTCGDAASRTITITITPSSGYTLFGTTKPVFTKTSGTVAATIGSVTDNGDGTFSYECTFNSNDNGAGTFAISPGQFTNYRTVCCTELGEIDGVVNITTDGCGGGEIKVTWKMEATTGIASQTLRVYDENADEVTAKRITSITPSTSNQTKTISGLDPCKDYLVTIENVSSGGSYCAAGAPWTSDVVTTLGYTYTITKNNVSLKAGEEEAERACVDFKAEYVADDGYDLPATISVSGASDYEWDNGVLSIDKDDVTGNVTVIINGVLQACDDYTFFYGTTQGSENNFECFSFVTGSTDTWLTDLWTIPSADQWTYVGEPSWNTSTGKSANLQLSNMPYALNHANNLGTIGTNRMEGAQGYLKICSNSADANRYVGFIPAGYVFRWGTDGSGWNSIAFTGKTSDIEEEDWNTPLQTWTSSNADDYTYVGLKTSSGYVWANRSETRRPVFLKPTSAWDHSNAYFAIYYFDASSHTGWSAIMTDPDGDGIYEAWIPNDNAYTTVNFVRLSTATADWNNKWNQTGNITLPSDKNVFTITGGSGDAYTGEWSLYDKKGTFHISANSNTNNWYCHFLPHHVLHYDANGGEGAPADQTIAVNASPCQLTVSTTEPTRTGYTFAGWNESSSAAAKDDDWDGGDTHTMSGDVTLYAVWTANTNTPYTVKHYKQKLDGTYDSTPDDTDNLTGTTGASITPDRKSYTGFTAPSGTTTTILADGSLVVEYQYSRNSYTLAWSLDGGEISVAGTTAGSVKYEASLTAPTVSKTGYTFNAWSPAVPSTMPAANSTYTATWTANTNTAYTVKHYKQKLDGTYDASPDETDNLTGTTATSVTPARKSYTGFTAPDAQTETILADGSLVITYNYTRNKYNVAVASVGDVTITATPSGGSAIAESADADVYYGQSVTLASSFITSGYFWAGWKVTKQSDGTDVTASVVSTNTLTVPAYAINVSAGLYTNAIAWCNPDVTVTGDVHLTSTKDVYVHSTNGAGNLISISSSDMGSATKMEVAYLNADAADAEVDKAESVFRFCNNGTPNYNVADESAIDLDYEWGTTHSIKYTPTDYEQRHNYKLQLTFKRGDRVLKTVTHAIYGRSLPEEFVIAVKNTNTNKWYALPSNLARTADLQSALALNPSLEIELDQTGTPTKATIAPSTRIYKATGRNNAAQNITGIRFTNDGSHWLQSGNTNTKLWLSGTNSDASQVFYLKSTDFGAYELAFDPSQSSPRKIGVYTTSGTETLGHPATGKAHSTIYLLPVETKIDELAATADDWTQHDVVIEANASSVSATKVLGVLGATTSDKETIPTPLASNTYLLKLDGDMDYANKSGQTLQFKWYDSSDKLKAYSWVTVPSIVAAGSNASWSALETAIERSTTLDDIVVLTKPMTVDATHAKAKQIVIDQNSNTGKLTVQANKGLEVAGTVKVYNGSAFGATTAADLILESSSSAGNASLIFDNSNGDAATVQMYSKAGVTDFGTKDAVWNWQYVGTPFTGSIPLYNYYGSWMYKWYNDGASNGWSVVHGSDVLDPFVGYCLTQESGTTHVMDGTLVATDGNDIEIDMAASTDMVIANSWTAPIHIASFTASTFPFEPATIYLFNTGSAEKGSSVAGVDKFAASTYEAVPIETGEYVGSEYIAPMQGFFIKNTSGSDGTITLKYDELVRPADSRGIVGGPMHAPSRERVDYGKPDVMKIWANGSEYNDRVVILAREDFSEGFDNGWDGEKLSFGNASPSVYVINEEGGYDAVSAIPEYEGTLVGFRAGSEDNVYTMTFEYNGDEVLYLNDLKAQMSAEIATGQTYTFTTEEGDSEVRFIISHNPIRRITTGVDEVVGGTKVRKIIINDKLFIIRGGRMFSADGQLVK